MKNKKVVFSEAWKVEIGFDEIDKAALQDGEIIIKNKYSLISAGTEIACLAGKESSWFQFPATPGYTSVGEIVTCGRDTDGFKEGDLVYCFGSHSAYVKLNVREELCVKVIEDIDLKYVPFTRIATIAMCSIRMSDIELGDYVGVTGLGVVGNMAAQLAKAQGGFVIGLDVDEARLKIAEKCGIKYTVNSGMEGYKDKVGGITGGKGVNTLIEATGMSAVGVNSLPLIGKNGEIILLGTPRDEYVTNATEILRYFHLAGAALKMKPAHEWIYPVKHDSFVKHSIERNTYVIFELIKNEILKVQPILSHVIKPEDTPKVYEALKNREKEWVGVIIDWN